MGAKLAKVQGKNDRTMRIRALTAKRTGEVFVPEEQAGSVHDVFHESIHRATWLRDRQLELETNITDIARQLASLYSITITADGRVDPNSEYIKQYAQTDGERKNFIQFFTETLKEQTQRVTEGLTEWTTRKANGMAIGEGTSVKIAEEDNAYEDEVQYMTKVRTELKEKKGLTDEQTDTEIITAALTGDISELLPYL